MYNHGGRAYPDMVLIGTSISVINYLHLSPNYWPLTRRLCLLRLLLQPVGYCRREQRLCAHGRWYRRPAERLAASERQTDDGILEPLPLWCGLARLRGYHVCFTLLCL